MNWVNEVRKGLGRLKISFTKGYLSLYPPILEKLVIFIVGLRLYNQPNYHSQKT